jgi:sec-independent protein translocase protein TatC
MSDNSEGTFISHLLELRNRLLRVLIAVGLLFVALVYFARDIYALIALPLIQQLPVGSSMIATDVASSFFVPMKLTLVLAVALAVPFILHQLWSFIAPGLYRHEKRLVAPLLVMSSLLFYAGAAFAYYVVFPIAFAFFTAFTPEGVQMATDIGSYLDFVLALFFAFGIAFEVPVLVILLCWSGISTPAALAAKRPYVVVIAFIVGAFLTPPDVLSQTLLAVPMWLLFELGLVMSRFYVRPDVNTDANDKPDDAEH